MGGDLIQVSWGRVRGRGGWGKVDRRGSGTKWVKVLGELNRTIG